MSSWLSSLKLYPSGVFRFNSVTDQIAVGKTGGEVAALRRTLVLAYMVVLLVHARAGVNDLRLLEGTFGIWRFL